MQLNKIFKGLLIALPVVTMVACQSGPTDEELQAQRNQEAAAQQAELDRKKREEEARVEANARERKQQEEERMKNDLMSLSNQVVYFDFDRASINSDFYSVLDQHAAFLVKNSGQSVVIEGHCDSRGTPEYNIALGESRAKSVQTYLLNAGVSASQISVVSYGEEKPANNGSDQAAFAENRRGVLVYQ